MCFIRWFVFTLSLTAVAADGPQTPPPPKQKWSLDDDPIWKYLRSADSGLAAADNYLWQNGGFLATSSEKFSLPSGGVLERLILEVSPHTKIMLISWSIDTLTNTHEPSLVPPSYQPAVWTETNGWQLARTRDGKPAIICGELESMRTLNGQNEYGFRWYGRGRGAKQGVDVISVVKGELQVVDSNRRDLDEFDGEKPPPAKNLGLTDTTFAWEWITLSRLVSDKPWQKGSPPRSKEEIATLINATPVISKADVLTWLATQMKNR